METFGQKIRRLRKAKQITQSELADAVGVDFTYISKMENGKGIRLPSEATIRRLAAYLDTDAEALILSAKKVPQNFRESIANDKLIMDFLRVVPKLNETQRGILEKIIQQAEEDS